MSSTIRQRQWSHYCGYTHTHWMFAFTSKGPSLLWTEWRARLMWYHAHVLNVRVDFEGPVAALDGMKSEAVFTGRWAERFVLVAVTRRERSRSEPARAVASWCRPVITCSFRWQVLLDHWLWRSVCPSITLCRLAGRDPMQLGAVMLHVDWLDGRTLGDWHLA
jgi:hypothetical protein